MRLPRRALLVLCAFALAACDRPQKTVDQTRQEIAAYQSNPSDAGQARIEAGLAKLDRQIASLDAKGKTTDAADYRARAQNLRSDYQAARMLRAVRDAQTAVKGLGDAFKEAGRNLGDALRGGDATPAPTP